MSKFDEEGVSDFDLAVKTILNDACTMVAKAFRPGGEKVEREKWITLINALEAAYPDIVKPLMK